MTIEPNTTLIHRTNSQARHAALAASRLGWSFVAFPETDGYLFRLQKDGRELVFGCGTCTPFLLNSATAYCLARDKVFTNMLLASVGIPIVPTEHFFRSPRLQHLRSPGREVTDALSHVSALTFPIFCKPNTGSRGDFAEIITSEEEFKAYIVRLDPQYDIVLVQPVLWGSEYRVIVLNGRPLCFYEKFHRSLVADGVRTVSDLMKASHPVSSSSVAVRGFLFRSAPDLPVSPDDVPARGTIISVFGRANRAAGAATSVPSREVPKELGDLACAAAARLGLDFSAVDLKYETAGRSGICHVLEVNSNPGLETLEEHGAEELIVDIWRQNIDRALQCQHSR